MMRWGLAVLVLGSAVAAGASAQEVEWTGTLRCGLIPGITTKRLVEAFTLSVNGNHAQYTRRIHKTDVAAYSQYVEQGDGTVAPDGSLTLHGGGVIGRHTQYVATYQGVLPPDGGKTRLTGVQLWTTPRTGQVTRDCRIDLAR